MSIFKSYFRVLVRNTPSLGVHFIIFLIMLFGMVVTAPKEDYEIKDNYKITIVNRDVNNKRAVKLVEFLNEKYKTRTVEDDYELMIGQLIDGVTDYVLVIDKGFKLKYYGSNQNTSGILINMTINEYLNNLNTADKYLPEKSGVLEKIMVEPTKLSYAINKSSGIDSEILNVIYRVIAYPLMTLIMNAVFIGLKNFNKQEVINRIEVSGVHRKKYTIPLYMASLVSVLALWLIINLIAYGAFTRGDFNELLKYMINSFVFILPITAIGYLLSNNIKNESAVNGAITIIGLGSSFISGIFVSKELLSESVLRIASFLPAYWYVKANEVVYTGAENRELLISYGVMIIITLGVLGLNVILKKRKPVLE
ncbi:ABC transporter permease [Microaceticoccus formicicus]|uniref:ABC transporter permease n=1 Tax=Microaceticoccus formicicus TaxID=3118105 RepID=UPI003CD03955|nr:ABC transporter permease [Peptoniphilaceae bacterium AMB_02]